MSSPEPAALVAMDTIERRIFVIRGQKVMLDADLASLYGVTTGNLNLAVRRNAERFPDDFMFRLTREELADLSLQIAISSSPAWGGRRYMPQAFTEHGVAMLSSVLRSQCAVQMNILIVRAFIRLREVLASHKELAHKLEELEREQLVQRHQIVAIDDLLQELMAPPDAPRRRIGF